MSRHFQTSPRGEETVGRAERASPGEGKIRLRAIAAGLFISIVGMRWLVYSLQVREAGGIELALVCLLLGVALRPLLRRWLTRADLLMVYIIVLIASGAYDGVSRFLPTTVVPLYFASPENHLARIAEDIPDWFTVKDPEIVRQFFEGADDGRVPWRYWWRPMVQWTIFLLVLYGALYCITTLLRRHWEDRERLVFPMAEVPLYLTADEWDPLSGRSLWRDPVLWIGALISAVHFATIMLHAANPSVPTLGNRVDLGQYFTEHPWTALRPLFYFIYNPALVGLAYFAPQDLCFSMFFFFVLIKLLMLTYTAAGIPWPNGFPFWWEQSAGAFLAIALFYLWMGRNHLRQVWRVAWAIDGTEDADEAMKYRWAILGLVASFAFLCGWYVQAGMTPWVAMVFFALVILFATVYTRGRAESGVPSLASFPFWQASRQIKSFFGSDRLMPGGSTRNLTLLGSLIYLHFGLYPQTMAFQIESLRIAHQVGFHRRQVTPWVLIAMGVGLLVTFHAFLTVFYRYGANVLAGGTTMGGYHVRIALNEYMEVNRVLSGTPLAPDRVRNGYTLVAFGITLALVALRMRFLRFPLHPLGYVLTASYGYAYWGPFLTAWTIKAIILHIGGVRLYRRLTPLFLGLVVGQVFTLSIVWQLVALVMGPDWQRAADPLSFF